jgi:hypothetical protein
MTDIVPLVSLSWFKSFGLIENAQKAISQRGWGPLNFVLLDHPDVRSTLKTNIPTTVWNRIHMFHQI